MTRFARSLSLLCVLFLVFFIGMAAQCQQPNSSSSTLQPTQSTSAQTGTSALSTAIAALGSRVPSDSVATGAVHLIAGSREEDGIVRILTRGTSETREEYNVPSGNQIIAFADGYASDNLNGGPTAKSAELAMSAFSPLFPLPYLSAAASDGDVTVTLIGTETLRGATAVHLQVQKQFGGDIHRRDLSELSRRDIWLDQATSLPLCVKYVRRTATGAVPSVAIELRFSDYRAVNGRQYPFTITKLVNGTPWAQITIQSVSFDTGLTAADFAIN